uniref:G_PROTEIN_RECEP_F1_2 domain-containing protein n=1 Tax=Elaeophora elaphi TaxID=1147741 RepID=A0A0R3RNS5_9BILA
MAYYYQTFILFLILTLTHQERNITHQAIRNGNQNNEKYVAILSFTAFILYGIISNTLMAIVLFRRRRDNHYSREFMIIAWQLIICDFMLLFPHIFFVLPETILRANDNSYAHETKYINRIFATFGAFAVYCILHFSFLLTLNRFVAQILRKYYVIFESTKLLSFLIAFVWLAISVVTLVDFHFCIRTFDAWKISWTTNCTKLNEAGKLWWSMRYLWSLFIPNAMFIMYIAIFCSIRHKRHFTTTDNDHYQ